MTQDDRIEKLEDRVTRLELSIESKLAMIFEKVNQLSLDSVKNACPSPGSCVTLSKELDHACVKFSKELEHAIVSHNATMLRVERMELKLLEIDRMTIAGFHKIETQKAWVLGAWSVVAFFAAVIGAVGGIVVNHWLK
jgi:hypothetical protein